MRWLVVQRFVHGVLSRNLDSWVFTKVCCGSEVNNTEFFNISCCFQVLELVFSAMFLSQPFISLPTHTQKPHLPTKMGKKVTYQSKKFTSSPLSPVTITHSLFSLPVPSLVSPPLLSSLPLMSSRHACKLSHEVVKRLTPVSSMLLEKSWPKKARKLSGREQLVSLVETETFVAVKSKLKNQFDSWFLFR